MKTLIKLLVVAAILHAGWKTGSAYWRFYNLQDEAQKAALFGGDRGPSDIHARIVQIARDLRVPINPEKLEVRREPNHILIHGTYTERIEVLPRYYYPWQFTLDLDVFTLSP